MKQSFLFAGAVLMMMSACSSNEVLNLNEGNAIQFSNAFIDKSARLIDPSYTQAGAGEGASILKDFAVYGSVTNTAGAKANIFDGVTVSFANGTWAYAPENIQYWVPNNTYQFVAVAPFSVIGAGANVNMDNATKLPTTLEYNVEGQVDLLFHKPAAITATKQSADIEFSFKHTLSLVQFTFTNNFPNSQITISNISVNDAYKTATLKLDVAEYISGSDVWTNQAKGNYNVNFGVAANAGKSASMLSTGVEATSQYARLLIPGTQDLNVSFTVKLYDKTGEVLLASYDKAATIPGQTFSADTKYNLMTEITPANLDNLQPITFTAKVENWTNNGNGSTTVTR